VNAPERSFSALVEREIPCYGSIMHVGDEILDFVVGQIPAKLRANMKALDGTRHRVCGNLVL
jgi:hypothetical protein